MPIELSLVPELDHDEARTILYYGKDTEQDTAAGFVRATETLRIQLGDRYLTIQEVRELEGALQLARRAALAYEEHVSGSREYRLHREGGQIICEHMGKTGPLRLSVKRRRERRCYECGHGSKRMWVPVDVHGPWKRHENVCAELCEPCVEKLLQVERRRQTGLKAV